MNNRIRELLTETKPYGVGIGLICMNEIEKFAELLIQECAEVADNADATREKWQSIGKFVKEHFGVEE